MKFSCFAPFGLFKFSTKPTTGEVIYRAMVANKGKAFDLTPGTPEEAKTYATAMGLAQADAYVERGGNQEDPYKVVELLPEQEFQWGLVPGEFDNITKRQNTLAARMLAPRGARRENVVAVLTAVLGSDFINYRTIKPAEIETWPVDPFTTGPGNFVSPTHSPKFARLLDPITNTTALVKTYYTPQEVGQTYLVGETITVETENTGLAERVTVQQIGEDSVGLYFYAHYTKAHGSGASLRSGPVPIWTSNQRTVMVVATSEAARDPETRRRVHYQMVRLMRSVTRWAIVEPRVPNDTTMGPFTLGTSPLGVTPLTSMSVYQVDVVSPVPFDPGTLALTGWWRAYAGTVPWAGTASMGNSGSHALNHNAADPSAGAALNGHTSADFNGSTQYLVTSTVLSTLFTAGAGSIVALVNARTVPTDVPGQPYASAGILAYNGGGYVVCGMSTAGFRAAIYDGAYKELSIACPTGSYHLLQMKWDGATLKARVNNGVWSSVAAGNVATLVASGWIGSNYNSTQLFDGLVEELMTANIALDDTDFDGIRDYVNHRYGLSI